MSKLDERLRQEYWDYTTREAQIAEADAADIDYYGAATIAAVLLKLRVPPFYYWERKRREELLLSGEIKNGGKAEPSQDNKE